MSDFTDLLKYHLKPVPGDLVFANLDCATPQQTFVSIPAFKPQPCRSGFLSAVCKKTAPSIHRKSSNGTLVSDGFTRELVIVIAIEHQNAAMSVVTNEYSVAHGGETHRFLK